MFFISKHQLMFFKKISQKPELSMILHKKSLDVLSLSTIMSLTATNLIPKLLSVFSQDMGQTKKSINVTSLKGENYLSQWMSLFSKIRLYIPKIPLKGRMGVKLISGNFFLTYSIKLYQFHLTLLHQIPSLLTSMQLTIISTWKMETILKEIVKPRYLIWMLNNSPNNRFLSFVSTLIGEINKEKKIQYILQLVMTQTRTQVIDKFLYLLLI